MTGIACRFTPGKRRPSIWLLGILLLGLLPIPFLARAQEPQFLQLGFEGREPVWKAGPASVPPRVTTHKVTEETAHSGRRSEYLQFQAQPGSYIHYLLTVGRARVDDEFTASLWLKANRPGMQFMARLVLPHETDPKTPGQPLTTLLRGDLYQTAGRWQRLELRHPGKLLKEQQTFLRAELKRDVNFADAYVDQLVLNLYGGPGQTDVWIDDLEVGPLLEDHKTATLAQPSSQGGDSPRPTMPARRAAEVKLERDQLLVSGKKFFVRGIRFSGTPLKTLRDAGFNTLWLDQDTSNETVEQAVNLGLWLVPMLHTREMITPSGRQAPGQLTSFDLTGRKMSRFMDQGAVLCWDLGGGLAAEQYQGVARTAQLVRGADPMCPVAANIWDGFQRYSRGVDQIMLGVHRWPLMTSLELPQYREWLAQRRDLAFPDTYSWTWIQTHLPDWFTKLVYGKDASESFTEPIGPQPEQIRLLTYCALSCGYRGLGFWSDRFLADSHMGRDRLLQMALLNQEIQLLEPLLVTGRPPLWVNTSIPQVKAAVMRTEKGVLCLPVWVGPGAQYVPGQAAVTNLTLVVPDVPNGTQAWIVSPAEVRTLKAERVTGGTKITLPEFGLTAAVVFTSDLSPTGLVVYLQDQTRRMSKMAAQWAHDLAQEELTKVAKIQTELEREGHTIPDAQALLNDTRRRIELSATYRRNGESQQAYAEADRALRPLRLLMRAQWEQAIRELDTPVASPYAVSFYTLPRHWHFRNEIRDSTLAANVLPDGGFEQPPGQTADQWRVQEEPSLDEVVRSARRVSEQPHEGRQALLLEIKPKSTTTKPPVALERSFLAVHSPAVRLNPGTLVRITGWIKVPQTIQGSADGALFYDSVGGEPLAVRLTSSMDWKRFTLYRRIPSTGSIHLTLAMTGLGQVYFDDVRIEPLLTGTATTPRTSEIQPVRFNVPQPRR